MYTCVNKSLNKCFAIYFCTGRKPYRCDSEKEQAKLVSDHLEDTLLGSRKELLYKFRDGVTLVDLEKELKTPYILGKKKIKKLTCSSGGLAR